MSKYWRKRSRSIEVGAARVTAGLCLPQVPAGLHEQQPVCVRHVGAEEQQRVQILQVQRLQSAAVERGALRVHPAVLARLGRQARLHHRL